MDFWERYRAIDGRDPRFDGQFVTAVRSTGIYCRPSCPARTPKASNVTFYETSAAAHEAGYRACKRCLPEAVPGTPAWNVRSDVAGRAMRLINDGVINREGVDGLALRLGYSTRHLNRILGTELGAGPLALARASRAQTARTLLVSTSMKLADVAFAAGFNSVRQFNDTITEVFALTPSALRATAAARASAPAKVATDHHVRKGSGTSLRLNLPYRKPYDPGIFSFLAARAIPGVEAATANSYSRMIHLPRSTAAFTVSYGSPGNGSEGIGSDGNGSVGNLALRVDTLDLRDLPVLLSRVRRLFDLDADPVAIDDVLRRDPRLEQAVMAVPGIRVPGAIDPQELLVRAMIGQQITVSAARTALGRLCAAGTALEPAQGVQDQQSGSIERLFPTAAQIAASGAGLLNGPRRRIESLFGAARAMAAGGLDFGYGDDLPGLRSKLLPLPGVGPWTVGYVAMRVIAAPDIFLDNDAAVRNGVRRLVEESADTAVGPTGSSEARSQDFREVSPWRSYATMHLWRAAAAKAAGAI
ncbi:DNA-3-methyladenine glycosylase 2 family protein [Arthrobacter sp. ISL-30]|uniref:DNA-3-methyladenine glycosylase 2 family protein n=1 Tax=Arthrobacter sp. ISL-30 TaxID=2819109 RepID=UPI001BE6A404|nr:AlkA N-terminal domain-containing protein [Arthrobacter sp. ISL-30]MBT2514200.1 DNA-3-methyladenine glycosylase 2 family protein [Arthrobacter sp. ISL-30]